MDKKLEELTEERGCSRWCWHDQSTKRESKLRELFEAAVRELEEEDVRLFRAFGQAGDWKNAQCQGLAYWVFEHNLVFPIFRAWLPLVHRVWWDEDIHRARGEQREDSNTDEKPGRRNREYINLVVEKRKGAPKWLFEAKWWAYGAAKSLLSKDVRRLRRARAGKDQGYLLTFWYGSTGELKSDLERAQEQAKGLDLTMLFVGVFPTHVYTWWDKQNPKSDIGYFALVAFSV